MIHSILLLLLVAMPGAAPQETNRSAPIRVLLVTGVDHPAHDWKTTAPALKEILEQDNLCTVRTVADPDVLASDEIFQYDVVVLHFRNERPLPHDGQAQANLQRLVKEGRGLVLVHFASGAFGNWPGYGELAGMVWDLKNTHDPRGPFQVHVTNHDQAITRDMKDFDADDELYIGLDQRRNVEVLATARSKVTGRDHPMAFTFPVGKGRVFHTPLGHDVRALKMPGTTTLIRRGCQWAAGRLPTTSEPRTLLSTGMSEQSPYERVLSVGKQVVCIDSFDPAKIKPYVRALAPLGQANILRDSPFDHKHHHALMLAFKVNGVNFWEEAPGCGHQKFVDGSLKVGFNAPADPLQSVSLSHRFHWIAESEIALADTRPAALLIEDRTLTVTVDEASKELAMRWHSAFQVGPRSNEVTLTGANYHGLGIRFRQDLDPAATHLIGGKQPDLSDAKQDVRRSPWGAVAFTTPDQSATVAIFSSPGNPGGEAQFFSMKHPFAYLSATPGLDQKPLQFHSGDTFAFDYLITIYPEIKSADFLAERGKRWVERMTETSR